MPIEQMVQQMLQLPEDELAQMDHGDLLMARKVAGRGDKEAQNRLASAEHRAFAREYTADNPLAAIPLAFMVPAYQISKALGRENSRSNASLDQALSGLTGIKEGLTKAFKGS